MDELKDLKTNLRPAIIQAIDEARAKGDLSENAEYHAARERQSQIEGKIQYLEDRLGRAEVIDVNKISGSDIKFGAYIDLIDEDSDEHLSYQIVGVDEADVDSGKLSIASPLARALIGKSAKSVIEFNTPGSGLRVLRVNKVYYSNDAHN